MKKERSGSVTSEGRIKRERQLIGYTGSRPRLAFCVLRLLFYVLVAYHFLQLRPSLLFLFFLGVTSISSGSDRLFL